MFRSALLLPFLSLALVAGPKEALSPTDSKWTSATFEGLKFRSLGPAVASGRIGDLAVHPRKPGTWYVAVASGGVWKTENAGTSWTPIFEDQPSYSIGCLALDPSDPQTLWVGTGENNSQRSVGYGDGLYKSSDGGKSWTCMGLKDSEHIAKILIHPKDSKILYVAVQGPLWKAGGERGLYKSIDGGKTWKALLSISEHTGVTDVLMDPRNPEVLYAAAYQRRRHVWTVVNGGPESALYKSADGGANWTKLSEGLPKEEMGRIGLALSPVDPDVIYATIEAANKAGGFFRSNNAGGSWERMNEYVSGSPQYYQEIIADPIHRDRVYAMDTWLMVTEDGGKTWHKVGERSKHVDNHALWINPLHPDHLLAGCDGGLYESRDRGAHWDFKANLPVTQFYRVCVDDDRPFYHVYGGTQDNQTLGGPARTRSTSGIHNGDWFVTQQGDGFQSQVPPDDPQTVYSQAQYGELIRFNRRTGEKTDIQPQPAPGEEPYRWNWDSPLIISPHNSKRLYFACQKILCSEDRGDSWKAISPDLTRRLDRNTLPVMGQLWSVDAVARHHSTSPFGNIVSLTESPRKEGLLFAGTDDGLVQVSEDSGKTWRKVETFPGIPERSYVSDVEASPHDAQVLYAAFDNHKMGDFKPYLLRSADLGKTWRSISKGLPERGSVHTVLEDPIKPGLLFCGTEFGLYFSLDSGQSWIQLKGDLPTIPVMDLAIQKREGDLVLATFGRGFYVLDDLSPLRALKPEDLDQEGLLFPLRKADLYIPAEPLGGRDKASLGDAFYLAPNPPFGAVFTYYLKEDFPSLKKARQSQEKKEGPKAPNWNRLLAEDRDEEPQALLTVRDEKGEVLRRIQGPAKAGFHRVAWDLRLPPPDPIQSEAPKEPDPWVPLPMGPMAALGKFQVELAVRFQGQEKSLGSPQRFDLVSLEPSQSKGSELQEIHGFHHKVYVLQKAVAGSIEALEEALVRLEGLKRAQLATPGSPSVKWTQLLNLENRLKDLRLRLKGDSVKSRYQEPQLPSISDRLERILASAWLTTTGPTRTQLDSFGYADSEYQKVLPELKKSISEELKAISESLTRDGAPWTPGALPLGPIE